MTATRIAAAVLTLLLVGAGGALGHEVRPALLQLTEVAPDRFDYLWRVPARGERSLSLAFRLPPRCSETRPREVRSDGTRTESRGRLRCDGGLAGASLAIDGLRPLRTEVLLRVDYLGGGSETLRARPEAPQVTLAGRRDLPRIAATYLLLGTEHILLGIDHLLFVFALLLLVSGWRRLVWTVTAFTLAHSLSLAGAVLGLVTAPAALIEPLIALSIVFVAAEAIHRLQGRDSLTTRRPWTIAFAFGLLHGFGFAGALTEVGLPAEAVPAALLFFNLGVEAGQLVFIALLLALAQFGGALVTGRERALTYAAAGAVGVLAGFWTAERTAAIWI